MSSHKIEAPFYPIVYVRGYAMRAAERKDVFHNAYYGFAETSVERREAPPPDYFQADIFEGQFIRFMKLKDYSYADAVNRGLEEFSGNPARSLWICRFYDQDFFRDKIRSIEEHAEDLRRLVCEEMPSRLAACGVKMGANQKDYRVILIAHSMGGLVCRTLIQNLLPSRKEDPKRWVHRLVTMGTPHRGIDLGSIPDFMENYLVENLNPFDANIFKEDRMRRYLKLEGTVKQGKKEAPKYDVHSLGDQDSPTAFPVKRCLCIIGSDHANYGATKHLTGGFSDGLVKQDRAYVVGGPRPASGDYPGAMKPFWANVHRAHSGYRGIVNSFESFENIHRFLFGNIRAEVTLEGLKINTPNEKGSKYFYDIEFLATVRGTGVFLHRREQELCENAVRCSREQLPQSLTLYTGFMNSNLKPDAEQLHSHFALEVRVLERRIKDRKLMWDQEYPARKLFAETLEVRIGDTNPKRPGDEVQYRWQSDVSKNSEWTDVTPGENGRYRFPLRQADSCEAELVVTAGRWPDPELTQD